MRVLFNTLGHLLLQGQFPLFSIFSFFFNLFPLFSICSFFVHCFPFFPLFSIISNFFPLFPIASLQISPVAALANRCLGHLRRKISAPATQNIGTCSATNFGACSTKQYVWGTGKTSACGAKKVPAARRKWRLQLGKHGTCGAGNRCNSHYVMYASMCPFKAHLAIYFSIFFHLFPFYSIVAFI